MTYIVFDLEWNQARYCKPAVRKILNVFPFRLIGEIIQIGAVKLDQDGNIIDDFKVGVKPQFFSQINKNVMELTGIDQEMLSLGIDFPEAINYFKNWCGTDAYFLSWGQDDIEVLKQNLMIYALSKESFKNFFDLQKIFSLQTNQFPMRQVALKKAVEYFSINQTRIAHDALNDAYYAAYIAQRLDINKGMKEISKVKKNDIFCNAICSSVSTIYNVKIKAEAFTKHKITRSTCPNCNNQMQNKRVIKINKNEYILLSHCEEHGLFYVKINFENDYSYTMTVRKTIYFANQNLIDFYQEKLNKKLLLDKKYIKNKLIAVGIV